MYHNPSVSKGALLSLVFLGASSVSAVAQDATPTAMVEFLTGAWVGADDPSIHASWGWDREGRSFREEYSRGKSGTLAYFLLKDRNTCAWLAVDTDGSSVGGDCRLTADTVSLSHPQTSGPHELRITRTGTDSYTLVVLGADGNPLRTDRYIRER